MNYLNILATTIVEHSVKVKENDNVLISVETMEPLPLVKEIIKTCQYFKIVERDIDNYFVEKKIIDGLDDIIFVENLLNIFYKKMKLKRYRNSLDQNRLKKLLIELEKIRLNLEFKGVYEWWINL